METAPLTAAGADAATQTPAAAQPKSKATLSSDFETFLRLLTAQLENQDPLNPLESTDFVAQLAQFSAVEQQTRTNDQLGAILAALGGDGATRLGGWLGAEVETDQPVRFDGAEIRLRAVEPEAAAGAALIVRDADGRQVARAPVDPEAETVVWNGRLSDGADAPPGFYSFSIVRIDAEGAATEAPALGFARVVEARIDEADQTILTLEGGGVTPAADVRAVREARATES